jgi:hypothetical protein
MYVPGSPPLSVVQVLLVKIQQTIHRRRIAWHVQYHFIHFEGRVQRFVLGPGSLAILAGHWIWKGIAGTASSFLCRVLHQCFGEITH